MKRLFTILSIIMCCQGLIAQQPYQRINAWGYEWKRGRFDSSQVPPRDSLHLDVADSGSISYMGGRYWGWTGYKWLMLKGEVRKLSDSAFVIGEDTMKIRARKPSNYVYGYRFNKKSFPNTSDFVNNGANVSSDGSRLILKGGASNYSQSIYINDPTCMEHWTITAKFTVDSVGGGFDFGPRSFNYLGVNLFTVAHFDAITGGLAIGVGYGTTPALFIYSPGFISYSLLYDSLELSLTMNSAVLTASLRNKTTGDPAIQCSYTYNLNNSFTTHSMLNNSRMTIFNVGGNYKIDSLAWFDNEPMYAKAILIGDSKIDYYASKQSNRATDILNNWFFPFINGAGNADALVDVLTRTNEVIGHKPEKALLAIGRNDIKHSIPNAIANYDTLVNRLLSAGIDVYHLLGFYEPALDQSLLINHIYATYPVDKIIDCYTPTKQAGILVDGVHGFDLFQRIIAETIIRSGKLTPGAYLPTTVIENQNAYTQSGTFNIDGPGIIKGLDGRMSINNTSPSSLTVPVFDVQLGDSSAWSISKTGGIVHKPPTDGIQYKLRLPLTGHSMANPIIQLQDSLGNVLFDINTNHRTNIFIGKGSGALDQKPTSDFSFGSQLVGVGGPAGSGSPLSANTSGQNNVGVGGSALGANSTGSNNTAVGVNASFANTVGSQNTAFGQASLAFDTSGNYNTALGYNSLRNVRNADGNVGLGPYAIWNNFTGGANVAIGYRALAQSNGQSTQINTSNNIFIGYQAGYLATNGGNNTVIGYSAHQSSVLGSSNVLIGALQTATGVINNTTALGDSINLTVSNVAAIAKASQNLIVGKTTISSDNGYRLQVFHSSNKGIYTDGSSRFDADLGFGAAAHASAIVDINSSTKGFLIPRMTTTQRDAISSPATSLLIFNTTTGTFQFYTGSAWQDLGGSSLSLGTVGSSPNANGLSYSGGILIGQPADGSNPGFLTATTQTIGGQKTFNSPPKFNAVLVGDTSLKLFAHGTDSAIYQVDLRPLIKKIVSDSMRGNTTVFIARDFASTGASPDSVSRTAWPYSAHGADSITTSSTSLATIATYTPAIVDGGGTIGALIIGTDVSDPSLYYRQRVDIHWRVSGGTTTVIGSDNYYTPRTSGLGSPTTSVTASSGNVLIKVTPGNSSTTSWKVIYFDANKPIFP